MTLEQPGGARRDNRIHTKRVIRLAALFYTTMAAIALLWGGLAGRPYVLWQQGRTSGLLALVGLVSGTLFGLAAVGLSRLLFRFKWAKALTRWFASVLGPLSWSDSAVLACFSAVGEEMLFRGAMQPSLGLIATTVVFGLAHVPPERKLWPWTASAALLGLAFGLGARWTRNLAGPIISHFLINLLNLRYTSHMTIHPDGDEAY
jgi:membrane protease YdiL (CAAX protease family)